MKLTDEQRKALTAIARLGGKASAASMTKAQRSARAKRAARARWSKKKK